MTKIAQTTVFPMVFLLQITYLWRKGVFAWQHKVFCLRQQENYKRELPC